MAPDRIPAALAALADYTVPITVDRVHVLAESPGRIWRPIADAPFARPAVVARGGLPLELTVTRLVDPLTARLLAHAGPAGPWRGRGRGSPDRAALGRHRPPRGRAGGRGPRVTIGDRRRSRRWWWHPSTGARASAATCGRLSSTWPGYGRSYGPRSDKAAAGDRGDGHHRAPDATAAGPRQRLRHRDALVIVAPLPAVQPSDVTIDLTPGCLRITAHLRTAAPKDYLRPRVGLRRLRARARPPRRLRRGRGGVAGQRPAGGACPAGRAERPGLGQPPPRVTASPWTPSVTGRPPASAGRWPCAWPARGRARGRGPRPRGSTSWPPTSRRGGGPGGRPVRPAQLAHGRGRLASDDRPVDLAVNNAGFGTYGPLADLDIDGEQREIAVNVLAVVRLTPPRLGPCGLGPRGDPQHLLGGRVAGDAGQRGLRRHQGVRGQLRRGGARRAGWDRRVADHGAARVHPHRVRRRAGIEGADPGPAWQTADEVAEAALDATRPARPGS